MYDLVVIGGGPAGMTAAGIAANRGKEVLLIEKNDQLGKKLLITGKGRCNLTNDCEIEEMINNFPGNGEFLYSSLYSFSNWQLRKFFSNLGVETKVERGNRVFPVSDSAREVREALKKFLKEAGVKIKLTTAVKEITIRNNGVFNIRTETKRTYQGRNTLLAAGGAAYPGTGSSGDGYKMAESLGHRIKEIKPSLVPLETKEDWVKEAQGLTLKNVTVSLLANGKIVGEEFGEMLLTHFGVSGPIILTLSRKAVENLDKKLKLKINLKPALSAKELDERLQRDFAKYSRKQFKNSLDDLLPAKLRPVIINLSSIPPRKFVHQITKEEREELGKLLTNLELTITGTRGLKEAIVTAGGVATDEINPTTLESKLVAGLYFAGEIIDIDGYTGGFNLQAAFSTGYTVGNSV